VKIGGEVDRMIDGTSGASRALTYVRATDTDGLLTRLANSEQGAFLYE
jgi:hypothetical protein